MSSVALQIGLVDFSEPTLLILGDAESFLWFAQEISSRRHVTLDHRGTRLSVVPTASGDSLAQDGAQFTWEISATEALFVAGQLSALAASGSPAHHYLDPERNETGVQIIASLGEYDARVLGGSA